MKKVLSLLIIWMITLNMATCSYAEIRFNPETNLIEMTPEDYKALIDTIRTYEKKLKLYQEELQKEREMFQSLQAKYEDTIKFSKEKINQLLDKLNTLSRERDKYYLAYHKEKAKNRVYFTVMLCVIGGAIVWSAVAH